MSYRYAEIKDGRKLSEMTESEQNYIREKWDRLSLRENINTPEIVFVQHTNGKFFRAVRCRIAAHRYSGSAGGYWSVEFGNCRRWCFKKNPFGTYDPEQTDKTFSGIKLESGEVEMIPKTISTKREVLEFAARIGFGLETK